MARYLKEEMGYKEVGLHTYSIGSLWGVLASMMYPGLFDFGIFHMTCDDFTEAVMKGFATSNIAEEIKGKIDYKLLKKLWSTISPGPYEKYLSRLPKNTRMVPCEYDFIFCPDNVEKFSQKIKKHRPDIDLASVPLGHTNFGTFPEGLESTWQDIAFIYKYSLMGKLKQAILFDTEKAQERWEEIKRMF